MPVPMLYQCRSPLPSMRLRRYLQCYLCRLHCITVDQSLSLPHSRSIAIIPIQYQGNAGSSNKHTRAPAGGVSPGDTICCCDMGEEYNSGQPPTPTTGDGASIKCKGERRLSRMRQRVKRAGTEKDNQRKQKRINNQHGKTAIVSRIAET